MGEIRGTYKVKKKSKEAKAAKLAISQQIKAAREALGWNFYRLAKESKVTITQLQSIESASSNYTIDCLLEVCGAMGLRVGVERG